MKSFLSLFFVTALLFTSCKKEVETSNTTPTNVVPFTEVGRQMQSQSKTSTEQQQNTNTQPTTVAAGMNPAHGQAGHRCDIAVGAPLNSVATTTAPATPQQNAAVPANKETITQPETTPTAEGMNPPHGQTNHRCDIAVGAPLPK
ncbi:hypothetical protein [Flavobacterium xueshanense]|jgi:uncharacterized membrane protein|uniref:Uncharacterized protein n=1 Tax=Flavobacterium xueshanense TaxID=935223 RepID=A0A1I2ELV4_9FLAO|nr:hypothetical protein [Flavobacterium xueshanense]SFE93361.1 hypothetical protein SAMN04488131_10622 [Flavobacterium xueshanense]